MENKYYGLSENVSAIDIMQLDEVYDFLLEAGIHAYPGLVPLSVENKREKVMEWILVDRNQHEYYYLDDRSVNRSQWQWRPSGKIYSRMKYDQGDMPELYTREEVNAKVGGVAFHPWEVDKYKAKVVVSETKESLFSHPQATSKVLEFDDVTPEEEKYFADSPEESKKELKHGSSLLPVETTKQVAVKQIAKAINNKVTVPQKKPVVKLVSQSPKSSKAQKRKAKKLRKKMRSKDLPIKVDQKVSISAPVSTSTTQESLGKPPQSLPIRGPLQDQKRLVLSSLPQGLMLDL